MAIAPAADASPRNQEIGRRVCPAVVIVSAQPQAPALPARGHRAQPALNWLDPPSAIGPFSADLSARQRQARDSVHLGDGLR